MLIKSLAPIGFSSYGVDQTGAVWRLKGSVDRRGIQTVKDFKLKPSTDARGYLHVRLTPDRGFFDPDPSRPDLDPDRPRLRKVHRLVAWAFLPEYVEWTPETRNQINTIDHVDGDKMNNNVQNLRIVSLAQNGRAYRRLRKKGYRPELPSELGYTMTVSAMAAEALQILSAEKHGTRGSSEVLRQLLRERRDSDVDPARRKLPADPEQLAVKTWRLSKEVVTWIRKNYMRHKMRIGAYVNAVILQAVEQAEAI